MEIEKKYKILLTVGLGLTAVYLTLVIRKKIREKWGIEFYKELENNFDVDVALINSNAFDMNYIDKVPKKAEKLTEEEAKEYAQKIWDAFSFWGDDEEAIKGEFRLLKSKLQISQVAKAFYEEQNETLEGHLKLKLDEEEFQEVLDIINLKPNY